ncbi:hypothetical protein DUI87_01850 [Hirundo rustica rustica]|uniref:ribonuclease H n=1 Tax=Hirundo rustica rustica TaxID=333673 RepID=A0A3M0L6N0_HIRRU|nr:hypothetical protein DUI87_01850 [Hirundo rustica rustica]
MLELQYELESKAAKWYATIDIANAFFSIPLAAECRPQFAFTWRGVQYTWNQLPQGWKHSPTICHGLIQTALEKGEAPEHLQYIDDIIVWGNTAAEVFEKGKGIIQILLEAGSLSRRIKQEIAHAVALGPVKTGLEVKNMLYLAARNNGLSWSLWQKVPGETRGQPLGFWSRSYRGSEANYTPTEKEILAAYEGVQAASEVIGMNQKWKAAVWSPTRQVAEATEGEGGSSQLAEIKAVQLALDIAEREGWPRLYLYTNSWMVANALWRWLKRWKEANWQHGGKPIWAAEEWKDIATRVGRLPVKVRHIDAHIPKSRANEEHRNNDQVIRAEMPPISGPKIEGMDLTLDSISQVIHDCETCAAIKQAKQVKPLWYGGRWSQYKYGEAWQIDYITLPQTRQGKRYVLTMVEATTGWLETYPVPHATARNTILGLENQVLWRHSTPERIESDNRTHFKNSLINNWAREHGIEWVYHIPYHAPAAGKVERHNALLKTQLKALGGGSFKNWEQHLAKATWLVNTRGSTNRAGPAQAEPLHTVDGDKVPVVHVRVLIVPRVLYHQEEEMYCFLEETILLRKREVMTGITIAMLLGLGATGTATGVSALVTQHQRLSQMQMTIDEDLLRIEKSISSLERSISSLSEVVLQNRRGLDLLLMQQGGLWAALREECCFYADHTGVVRDSMAELRGRLAQRKREREAQQGWFESWFNQSPWLATLVPTLIGPLTMILLALIFGPCILNKLVSFVRRRLEKVDILFVERMQLP